MSHTQTANLEIAGHLTAAGFGFGIAYGFWHFTGANHIHGPYDQGDWLFVIFAGACALGGGIRLIKGLFLLTLVLWKRRKENRFAGKGKEQKSDATASSEALKERGLIK